MIGRKTFAICALLAVSVAVQAQNLVWETVLMDGSRTGVTIPTVDNVPEAMGTVGCCSYTAPNGRVFRRGSTRKVARLMLDAQPAMAYVKEVVGHSPKAMHKHRPESELSNWFVDAMMLKTAEITGKHVDLGLANFGGIRTDMPEGDVLLDDIMSMFPFRNHICYVGLKGSEVRHMFEQMASRGGMQVVGGVEVTVKDRELAELKIGGEPVDDERIYGLATIDFLLNGGDNLFAARNAVELITTDVLIFDAIIDYVRELKAAGKEIEYHTDGRVKILRTEE